MLINPKEILETIQMVRMEHLDIRTVTMGISLRDCSHPDIEIFNENIYAKITSRAKDLVRTTNEIQSLYGIPIINRRISVTPIAIAAESCRSRDFVSIAKTMDEAAKEAGVDFIGGFSALVHKGETGGDLKLINSIPEALASTEKSARPLMLQPQRREVNMDAVGLMGKVIQKDCGTDL